MDEMVEKVCSAVRKSDYAEVRRLLGQLVTIGACDAARTAQLLGSEKAISLNRVNF